MENKILKLKVKNETPFISNTGTTSNDAVLIVSRIENDIIDKQLNLYFTVFNSTEDLLKRPIDNGFILAFNKFNKEETIIDSKTGQVIKWGYPSYTEVLNMFDITENGIVLSNPLAKQWFLNTVKFKGKLLKENWETI